MITIQNKTLDVDYEEELSVFEWRNMKIRGNKLMAASPFRDEKHPSFAVNLENGLFIDSGGEGVHRQGNFVKLLSFLRDEPYEESEIYLLEKYFGIGYKATDDLKLDFSRLQPPEKVLKNVLDISILKNYEHSHPYLSQIRGIHEDCQRMFMIGYDKERKGISIPLFDKDGQLVNIKFRSVVGKKFWYYGIGEPVRNHLWGLHRVNELQADRVFIVESEIDAMNLWQIDVPAIATMGSSLTKQQRDLLLGSDFIKEIVIMTDNDKAGRNLGRQIYEELNGFFSVEVAKIPDPYKDVNDLPPNLLLKSIINPVKLFLLW